jgi:dethiobiotin synthetase
MVVGVRLGCISHSLLTMEAIVARNLVLAGWVANQVDPDMRFGDENIETLMELIPAPLLGRVPFMKNPSAAKAAEFIELAGLPGWPPAQH